MATKRIAIISTTKESARQILSSYDYYDIQAVWDENSYNRANISPSDASYFSALINESGVCLDAESLCWLGVCDTYEDAVLILHKLLNKFLQASKGNNCYVVIANIHE